MLMCFGLIKIQIGNWKKPVRIETNVNIHPTLPPNDMLKTIECEKKIHGWIQFNMETQLGQVKGREQMAQTGTYT